MTGITGLGSYSFQNTNRRIVKDISANWTAPHFDMLKDEEKAGLNKIKDILNKHFSNFNYEIDSRQKGSDGPAVRITVWQKDILGAKGRSLTVSYGQLRQVAEGGKNEQELIDWITQNVGKEKGTLDYTDKAGETEEETRASTYINAKGERILVIEGPFGTHHVKIGEAMEFFTNDFIRNSEE